MQVEDERKKTVLKVALELLISDLRGVLTEFGQAPKGNALYTDKELTDLSASHQQFFDPQHCDGGEQPQKGSWVDANRSTYPVSVAKAYWNSAQILKELLEVEKASWTPAAAFGLQFVSAQKKMNACFEFIDNTPLTEGEAYRTQSPQVVDQRSLRLAKIYQRFIDTLAMDSDPMEAIRLSFNQYRGGEGWADTVNGYKGQFQQQFSIASKTLAKRIGIYEARLNENLRDGESNEVVTRVEKLRGDLRTKINRPQQYCDAVEKAVSEGGQFLQSPDYRNLNNAQERVLALEEQLQRLERIADVNVTQIIAAIEEEENALDSFYTIVDPSYAVALFKGEPIDDLVKLMNTRDKEVLKQEYEHGVQKLEDSKNTVEKRRDDLRELKSALQRELNEQREILKQESKPSRPTVGLSSPAIFKKDLAALRADREFLVQVIDEFKKNYPAGQLSDALDRGLAALDHYIDYRQNRQELTDKIQSLRDNQSELNQVLNDLKEAKFPLDEKSFEKLKKAMRWDEAEANSWSRLKEGLNVSNRFSVWIGVTTDPLILIRNEVEQKKSTVEAELGELESQLSWIDKRSDEYQPQFVQDVEAAASVFSEIFSEYTATIMPDTEGQDLKSVRIETANDFRVLSEQVFGSNPRHQELFEEFDRQSQALPTSKAVESVKYQGHDQPRDLYDKYFGENGVLAKYLPKPELKKSFSVSGALQKAMASRSERKEEQQFLKGVQEKLNEYQQNSNPIILGELQGVLQQKLRDPKKATSRLSFPLRPKQLEQTPLENLLKELEKDIKTEMRNRLASPKGLSRAE